MNQLTNEVNQFTHHLCKAISQSRNAEQVIDLLRFGEEWLLKSWNVPPCELKWEGTDLKDACQRLLASKIEERHGSSLLSSLSSHGNDGILRDVFYLQRTGGFGEMSDVLLSGIVLEEMMEGRKRERERESNGEGGRR